MRWLLKDGSTVGFDIWVPTTAVGYSQSSVSQPIAKNVGRGQAQRSRIYNYSDSVIGTRFIYNRNIRSNRINSTEYRTPNILNTKYSPNICPTNSYNINFFTIRVSLSFVMPGLLSGICWRLRSTRRLLRGSHELLRCKFGLLRGIFMLLNWVHLVTKG